MAEDVCRSLFNPIGFEMHYMIYFGNRFATSVRLCLRQNSTLLSPGEH